MSVPIALAVVLNLQAALQGISQAAGYNYDIKATSVVLDPVGLDTVPETEVPFIVLDAEENGTNDYATSRPVAIKNDYTIPLWARIDAPGDDPSRKRTAAWLLYADIETAVAIDPQRGGVAMYTYVQWPTFYFGIGTQDICVINVPIRILLQRTYGKP